MFCFALLCSFVLFLLRFVLLCYVYFVLVVCFAFSFCFVFSCRRFVLWTENGWTSEVESSGWFLSNIDFPVIDLLLPSPSNTCIWSLLHRSLRQCSFSLSFLSEYLNHQSIIGMTVKDDYINKKLSGAYKVQVLCIKENKCHTPNEKAFKITVGTWNCNVLSKGQERKENVNSSILSWEMSTPII